MTLETKFVHLRRPATLGERMADGWRVCWIGGWDRGRVFFLVMVMRHMDGAVTHVRVAACQ